MVNIPVLKTKFLLEIKLVLGLCVKRNTNKLLLDKMF